MAIKFSCPISGKMRDNTTARVVAGLVFITSVAAFLVSLFISAQIASIITGILSIDFIIRAFLKPKYSLFATLARGIVSGLNLPPKMVDSGPKVFAARIGLIFSVVTTALFAANLLYGGLVVIGILILCASLESFLSFCLGCWMYSLLPQKVGNVLAKEFVE